ncbi:MAG: hypothetical protein L3J53_01640 [Proteobacteria bacterium]|nr:hypothetical protein [Pseudomonadota bacterium]
MFTIKNKIITCLMLMFLIAGVSLVSSMTLLIMTSSTVVVLLVKYLVQNTNIDYKYVASFVGQLLALIFIVASFILVFTMVSQLWIHTV